METFMEVRYIGDPDDGFAGPSVIEQYGYEFPKGKFVTVPDGATHGETGLDILAKFKGNRTFEVKGDADDVDADTLRSALDARGISYRKNASPAALQKLLDEREEPASGPPE